MNNMFFLQAHLALDEIRYQYQPIMSLIYKIQDMRWLTFNLGVVLPLDVSQDLVNAVYLVGEPGRWWLFSLRSLLWHAGLAGSLSPVSAQTQLIISSLTLMSARGCRPIREKRSTTPNWETWLLTGTTCHLTRISGSSHQRWGPSYSSPSTWSQELFRWLSVYRHPTTAL